MRPTASLLLLTWAIGARAAELPAIPELIAPAQIQAPLVALPSLPILALPPEIAQAPIAAFLQEAGPVASRPLLDSLIERLRGAAGPAVGAVLDSFWKGPAVAAEAGAPETVAERLDRIVAVAQSAPTGRAVLARAAKAAKNGPRRVAFAKLGKELGRYDYVDDTLSLDKRFLSGDPRLAAATLVHELAHIAQHSEGLPAEALELELEAHAIDLQVMTELGVPEKARDEFSREAQRRLRRGPDDYVRWMKKQMPGKFYLEGKNFGELADAQEEELESQEDSSKNRASALAAWTMRDIKLLRSKAGRERYAQFSKDVAALLKRLSRSL